MLYERLSKRKKELGLTTQQLSELSGVPVGTINKILNGETRSPRYDTLNALESVLLREATLSNTMNEAVAAYMVKKQGEYTLDDYYALPEDIRAELIDGELNIMDAPSTKHQSLIMELLFEIKLYIRTNKGTCKILPSPLDVQLDCDDKTMVQPDISVICAKDKVREKVIFGAPDFCIEIISPSSRKRDYSLKMVKYMNAGVREYWIVDPKRETVVCYFFEAEDYPCMYTFQDTVPVRIFDEKLKIDFSVIKEQL